jgi:hypothetical protein
VGGEHDDSLQVSHSGLLGALWAHIDMAMQYFDPCRETPFSLHGHLLLAGIDMLGTERQGRSLKQGKREFEAAAGPCACTATACVHACLAALRAPTRPMPLAGGYTGVVSAEPVLIYPQQVPAYALQVPSSVSTTRPPANPVLLTTFNESAASGSGLWWSLALAGSASTNLYNIWGEWPDPSPLWRSFLSLNINAAPTNGTAVGTYSYNGVLAANTMNRWSFVQDCQNPASYYIYSAKNTDLCLTADLSDSTHPIKVRDQMPAVRTAGTTYSPAKLKHTHILSCTHTYSSFLTHILSLTRTLTYSHPPAHTRPRLESRWSLAQPMTSRSGGSSGAPPPRKT